MTFLAKEQNKEEYLEQMTQLSKSAKIQTKYVLQRFDQFCNVSPFNFREMGQDATLHAVKTMNEKKVVIHPRFKDLLTELQLARFNERGTVEKKDSHNGLI